MFVGGRTLLLILGIAHLRHGVQSMQHLSSKPNFIVMIMDDVSSQQKYSLMS